MLETFHIEDIKNPKTIFITNRTFSKDLSFVIIPIGHVLKGLIYELLHESL